MLKVTFAGKSELIFRARTVGETAAVSVRNIVASTALQIAASAVKNAPVDMGQVRSQIRIDISEDGYTANVVCAAKHAAYVEFGTGPRGASGSPSSGPLPDGYKHHGGASKMPPIDILEEWVKRKGIASGGDSRRVAYLIAKKIQTTGLPARPFMYPALKENEAAYYRKIQDFVSLFQRGVA